jgi:hypothetical protein
MPFALRKPEAADVSDGSKGVLPNPSCHLRNLVRSPIDSCRGAVDQPPFTLCAHIRTHAPHQMARLFDHLVRDGKQRQRHVEAERPWRAIVQICSIIAMDLEPSWNDDEIVH